MIKKLTEAEKLKAMQVPISDEGLKKILKLKNELEKACKDPEYRHELMRKKK
jgi:hypothetical protein